MGKTASFDRLKRRASLLMATIGLACTASPAHAASDIILTNGKVFTAAATGEKWAESISITGDHIDAVGSASRILSNKGKKTKIVDLKGAMVIPGITDNHVHPRVASLVMDGFNFFTPELVVDPSDRARFVAKLREASAARAGEKVLFGRVRFLPFDSKVEPSLTLAMVDEAVPDRPLVIYEATTHALFLNSRALAMAGITDKPYPDARLDSLIRRDRNGRPTGIVEEAAMEIVQRSLPPIPMSKQVGDMTRTLRFLNSFGVTSIVAMTGGSSDFELWDAMRKEGKLTVRVRQSFGAVAFNHRPTPEFFSALEQARSRYHDDWISANLVKFFMDGLSMPLLYTPAEFATIVGDLDRRGFQVATHVSTHEAAKRALDGYAAVARADGPRDRRWRFEHALSVDADDLPRLAELGVIVSTQPFWCCSKDGQLVNPMATFVKIGARPVLSSDWPCTWPPNPFLGIRQAAMRYRSDDPMIGATRPFVPDDHPEERISVEQALIAYTRDAAYANRTETRLGTLEAGKLADLVVLSQNILQVPGPEIDKTAVRATMVGGKVVYGGF